MEWLPGSWFASLDRWWDPPPGGRTPTGEAWGGLGGGEETRGEVVGLVGVGPSSTVGCSTPYWLVERAWKRVSQGQRTQMFRN